MRVKSIPSSTLTGVVALLAPHVPGLDQAALQAALRAYEPDGEDQAAPAPGESVTIAEACRRLSCSRTTIFRLVRDGKLRAFNLNGRSKRIPAAELARLASGEGGQTHA